MHQFFLLLLLLAFSQLALPHTHAQTLRVALLSDFNGPYGATSYPPALARALAQVKAWQPDAVLSAGDLVAGQKASLSDAQVQAMWAAFERDVHGPLRAADLPFAAALGNHDAALARDRREAARYWQTHKPALRYVDSKQFPFNYSFALQARNGRQAFIVMLDAPQASLSAETLRWLEAQLASAQAQAAGVRLVVGHLPIAAVSQGKNRAGEVLRRADAEALARTLKRTGTLAYMSGHHAAAYPATWNGVNALATGGIGGRDYIGHPNTARDTWTRLEIDVVAGTATFEVVDIATGAALSIHDFPNRLNGLGGPLRRVDSLQPLPR